MQIKKVKSKRSKRPKKYINEVRKKIKVLRQLGTKPEEIKAC